MTTGRINQVGTSPQGWGGRGRTGRNEPSRPPLTYLVCFEFFPSRVVRPARGRAALHSAVSGVREERQPHTTIFFSSRTTEARCSGPLDTRRRTSPLRGAGSQDCTDGVNVSTPERPFPGDHLHRWTASRGARVLPRASRTGGRFIAGGTQRLHETTPSTTAPDRRAGPQSRGETPR